MLLPFSSSFFVTVSNGARHLPTPGEYMGKIQIAPHLTVQLVLVIHNNRQFLAEIVKKYRLLPLHRHLS